MVEGAGSLASARVDDFLQTVRVALGSSSYDVLIGPGALGVAGRELAARVRGPRGVVVTNARVRELYGGNVTTGLGQVGLEADLVVVPAGERAKTLGQARRLYDRFLAIGLDRTSFVVGLGGGVVGDLAGFAAATYLRGLDSVQLPTTLLAQVDSSVGGKTAVNLPQGKNLVGAFHQPRLVVADVSVLATLALRELRAGLAEVVRYAVMGDAALFDYLEAHASAILRRDESCLTHVVRRCCEIKAEIVAADERERGTRALLNLGHTVGHALEQVLSYRRLRHGEAVGLGMIAEGHLAVDAGLCAAADVERIGALLRRLGLPVALSLIDPARVAEACLVDKKRERGRLRLALPRAIGEAELVGDIPLTAIERAVARLDERCD